MDSLKCNMFLVWTVVLLTSQSLVFGSIIELNDTTLAEFPPLFTLDEWARCQRPGDRYCVVDAALVSAGNDTLMDLLTAYSAQSSKHYNRTQIHRGVCVTRCANDDPAACLDALLQPYGLQAKVLSVDWCSTVEEKHASLSAKVLGGVILALIILSFAATIMHLFEDRSPKICGNKFLKAFSLKQNWAILTYDRCNPRTEPRMKDIACIEGLRVIGIQCVIFSHVFLIFVYSYVDNPQSVEKMYDTFTWQAVINSPLWLQALFAFSGFLQMYNVLLIMEKQRLTLLGSLNSVFNRWIRLTPVAAVALWFTIAWYGQLGAGPQWGWLVVREAEECAERWWYHMLYLHNYLPLGKACMGHTWYLAADMQLHIVGTLVLLAARGRAARRAVLATLVLAGVVAAGAVAYVYDLQPIVTAQAPEQLRTFFKTSRLLPLLYLPFWMNMAGFFGGMLVADLVYQDQKAGGRLRHKLMVNILFHLSPALGGAVVLAGTVFLWDTAPGRAWAALYAALDRPLVALCLNFMLLGCFTRCKSMVRDALEWRGFHVLGRLTYCAFINHFIVMRLLVGAATTPQHAAVANMMTLQITVSVLSYLVAVPMCLLLELPPIQLHKALYERRPKPTEKAKIEETVQVDRIHRSRV